jgi:hypothetical protein
MVYSDQLQATHCYEKPAWKGVWRDAKGRSHYVEACREHAPKASPVMFPQQALRDEPASTRHQIRRLRGGMQRLLDDET